MRQVINKSDRHYVANHLKIGWELHSRRVGQAVERPPRIHRAGAGHGIVRLHVLLQFDAGTPQITDFQNQILM